MTEAYEATWLDEVLEDSLTPNPTTNQTSTKPLSFAWLKHKERWPDYAEQKLEALMIQHQFFSYQKTNGESSRKMEAITHDMRSIFGTTSWIDNNHEDLLRKKIAHKLGRIRGAMRDRGELVDSRDGLVYQPSGASAMSDTLSAFENAARQLAPTEASQALYCLRGIFGSSWILEEVITWDPDCSDTGATGDLVAAQSAAGA